MPTRVSSAGQLTQRVTFQLRVAGEDEFNQPSTEFADVCTVWAFREGLGGSVAAAAGAETLVSRERFVIRFRADVNATGRVMWRGAAYRIDSLQLLGDRGEWLELVCRSAS